MKPDLEKAVKSLVNINQRYFYGVQLKKTNELYIYECEVQFVPFITQPERKVWLKLLETEIKNQGYEVDVTARKEKPIGNTYNILYWIPEAVEKVKPVVLKKGDKVALETGEIGKITKYPSNREIHVTIGGDVVVVTREQIEAKIDEE